MWRRCVATNQQESPMRYMPSGLNAFQVLWVYALHHGQLKVKKSVSLLPTADKHHTRHIHTFRWLHWVWSIYGHSPLSLTPMKVNEFTKSPLQVLSSAMPRACVDSHFFYSSPNQCWFHSLCDNISASYTSNQCLCPRTCSHHVYHLHSIPRT